MIGVTAKLTIQDGKQSVFEEAVKKLMADVRANEPECTLYQFCKTKGSETEYMVIEVYENEAALAAHSASDHFKAAQPSLGACLAGMPEIAVHEFVS